MSEKIPSLRETPVDFTLEVTEEGTLIKDLQGEVVAQLDVEIGSKIDIMLKIQQVAELGGTKASELDSELIDRPVRIVTYPDRDSDQYQIERKQIVNENCHGTAYKILPEIAKGRFNYEYSEVEHDDLLERLHHQETPFLLECGWQRYEEYEAIDDQHSLVVIGNSDNKIICFQKMGYTYPYEVIDFEEVFRYWDAAARKRGKDLQWKIVPQPTEQELEEAI